LAANSDPNFCRVNGNAGSNFNPGQPFEVVRVRVCYLYDPLLIGAAKIVEPDTNGNIPVDKTRIFRVEPFSL